MISKPLGRPRRESLCRSRRTPPRGSKSHSGAVHAECKDKHVAANAKHVTAIGHHHAALFEFVRGVGERRQRHVLIDECQQFGGKNTFLGPAHSSSLIQVFLEISDNFAVV